MSLLGIVQGDTGTGVRLNFRDGEASALLSAEHVTGIVRAHFYPLLDARFADIICILYPGGVEIVVNDEPVTPPSLTAEATEYFSVRSGKRKQLLGIGMLVKVAHELPEDQRGLAISTFGKVIKRGWEWLGVPLKHPEWLAGIVEMPDLVACLTTNKCDFMRDPNSLQKYYKVRKAIQDAVGEVLEKLGESRAPEPKPDRSMAKLQKEIDKVVGEILPDFPELQPLFGRKKSGEQVPVHALDPDGQVQTAEVPGTDVTAGDFGGEGTGEGVEGYAGGPMNGTHQEPEETSPNQAVERVKRRKRPGLMIGFDDQTRGDEIGWLRGNTLYVNSLHPAYKRVQESGEADLYVTFAVASTLSAHVQEERAPLEFVQRFMAAWGAMR